MKLFYYLLCATMLFSQELEVDGALKVTGEIDATGNVLTNLGDPVGETDAVNLRSLSELGGMKPERIYRYDDVYGPWNFTVPAEKLWVVNVHYGLCNINDKYIDTGGAPSICLFSNDVIRSQSTSQESSNSIIMSIYQYSISSSGTDQGLDYIEP